MKKHWKKCLAFTLSLSLAFGAPAAALWSRMSFGAERPATVKATSLNIRSGPGTKNASVGKLSYGAAVTVVGEAAAADGRERSDGHRLCILQLYPVPGYI